MLYLTVGSAEFASSLAAGVHHPIQASSDVQAESGTRSSKPALASPPAGIHLPIQVSSDVQADSGTRSSKPAPAPASTPPTEREIIRLKRLERFSSEKSNPYPVHHTERMTSKDSVDSNPMSPSGAVAGEVSNSTQSSSTGLNEGAFEVGDLVQVYRPDSAPWYGVIKWIGTLPGTSAQLAGIEMVRSLTSIQIHVSLNLESIGDNVQ